MRICSTSTRLAIILLISIGCTILTSCSPSSDFKFPGQVINSTGRSDTPDTTQNPDDQTTPANTLTAASLVTSISPEDGAFGVEPSVVVTATFSEPMAAESINNTTFLVYRDFNNIPVEGEVLYDPATNSTAFTPLSNFALTSSFTITISKNIKTVSGVSPIDDFISQFTVREGGWNEAKSLTEHNTNAMPKVVRDIKGNETVEWLIKRPLPSGFCPNPFGWSLVILPDELSVSQYTNGEWSTPQTISSPTSIPHFDITSHDIGIDNAGNIISIWEQNNTIRSKTYTFNTHIWSKENMVSNSSGFDISKSKLAVASTGKTAAIWRKSNEFHIYNIYPNYYSPDSGWIKDDTLLPIANGADTISAPDLSINANGSVIAAWAENNKIYANYARSGKLNALNMTEIENIEDDEAKTPKISLNDSDNALAVWINGNNVYSNLFTNETWNPLSTFRLDNLEEPASDPQVVLTNSGNGMAVWIQLDETAEDADRRKHLYARKFAEGEWEDEIHSICHRSTHASAPKIAMADGCDPAVVWVRDNVIWYNYYHLLGEAWDTESKLSQDRHVASEPYIFMSDNCSTSVVWVQDKNIMIKSLE